MNGEITVLRKRESSDLFLLERIPSITPLSFSEEMTVEAAWSTFQRHRFALADWNDSVTAGWNPPVFPDFKNGRAPVYKLDFRFDPALLPDSTHSRPLTSSILRSHPFLPCLRDYPRMREPSACRRMEHPSNTA